MPRLILQFPTLFRENKRSELKRIKNVDNRGDFRRVVCGVLRFRVWAPPPVSVMLSSHKSLVDYSFQRRVSGYEVLSTHLLGPFASLLSWISGWKAGES